MASEADLIPGITTRRDAAQGFFERMVSKGLGWARKNSLWQYPFVTACCGMEYMSVASARYDIARFGAEVPRFSPRQADLLLVVGTINCKQAPILQRVYEQMSEPKWVIAFGVCASSGGFYDNYATTQGIDRLIPVDIYIPGCPPRPEQVLDGLMLLQAKVQGQSHKLIDRVSVPELAKPQR
jgi:NADH-quinone oxidoreductase subunit B